MKQVRISEFKSHLSQHLRSAEAGEVIEILDRDRPIARVVAVRAESPALELIAAQRSFASVRSVPRRPVKLPMTSLEALRLERGSR